MELTDQYILNYLMTSEFTEGLTPDEFKFLLNKFRYFYRVLKGQCEYLSIEIDTQKSNIIDIEHNLNNKINSANKVANDAVSKYNLLINRRLSFRERFAGKIIINEK